jgi:hypothetical protein
LAKAIENSKRRACERATLKKKEESQSLELNVEQSPDGLLGHTGLIITAFIRYC